ncbi:MAG: hypothetical protein ABI675_04555 [Chitinophagaceae bacterium]
MSSLKDRIYNYEVTPPAGTWDKIAIDLNEAELANEFPNRLYSMEATPPVSSWQKIDALLNPVGEDASLPFLKRIIPFLRYAAAAIFIGVAAFGIIRLTAGNKNNLNTAAETSVKKDSSESGTNKAAITTETQTDKSDTNSDDAALEESKNMVARLDRPVKAIARKLSAGQSQVSYTVNLDPELSQSIYAYEDHVPNLADRYVMLMTPDGNIIRMSKKWCDLLCCVSGEEQDPDCKDQLKKWQQKIATSSLAPSPGNFMDILGLVNSLNEATEL